MTEAERIMQKGFLREDFLKEEVICDFLVDEKRKKIWAIELDLLREFDRVCKKYGLKYFLMYGSLLGAIRHKGIIPWDDDLDVAMFREDYEKFIDVAKNEFEEPYFLQTPYTDEGYLYSFIKIRNSNSTAVSKAFQYETFNQGIFLDIFPLDYCEPNELSEQYNRIKELILINSIRMKMSHPDFEINDMERSIQVTKTNPMQVYEEIQNIARKHNGKKDRYVTIAVFTVYDWKKSFFEKEDFVECSECDFEGIKVPIPKGYDKILTKLYGDYSKFPPFEERGKWHSGAVFEPDVKYKEFLNER